MAIETLVIEADEESAFTIQCAFTDEDGAAVTPDSISWTLTDEDGSVINSKEQEAVGSPASTVNIVLSGDDLEILSGEETYESVNRIFTVEAVYDSDYGSDLPLRDSCRFVIRNLKYVT